MSVCLPVRSSVRPLLDRQQVLNWCQASIALHCVLWHCVYDGIHSLFWCDTERRIHPSKESAHACVFVCVCLRVSVVRAVWWYTVTNAVRIGWRIQLSSTTGFSFSACDSCCLQGRVFCRETTSVSGSVWKVCTTAIPCSCRRFTELKLLAKTWNCLIKLDGKALPLSD